LKTGKFSPQTEKEIHTLWKTLFIKQVLLRKYPVLFAPGRSGSLRRQYQEKSKFSGRSGNRRAGFRETVFLHFNPDEEKVFHIQNGDLRSVKTAPRDKKA